MTALFYYVPHTYFFAYFIFFSALIITIRSDLETMLISRYATLFLVPIGFLFSFLNMLPITPQESIVGTLGGYLLLFAIAKIFYSFTGKHGLGQGDVDLIAFVGSFTGFFGAWATILVGSIVGSIIGLSYMLIMRHTYSIKIPFGPFLAGAAISYIFVQDYFIQFLFAA